MKKIILFLSAILFITSQLLAQKALIKLTFTGTLNSQYVSLDSIRVENLTQPGDTVLYWPDTTLSLVFSVVGIQEQTVASQEFGIRLLNGHDGTNETSIAMTLPSAGDVEFRVFGMSGSFLKNVVRHFDAGIHTFRVSGGEEKMLVLTAHWKGQAKSLKVSNFRDGSAGNVCIHYDGISEFKIHPKSVTLTNSFAFSPGDSLKINGFVGSLQSVLLDNPGNSNDYVLPFEASTACQGISSFSYGGQTYHTVEIGAQCWMQENLNIGTMVASIYGSTVHSDFSNDGIIEKYCYQNLTANCAMYGGLYDWNEMMQYSNISGAQGICPTGWHIPADNEWQILANFLGGTAVAGGSMKQTGFSGWLSPNTGATNQSGFTALGAGHRFANGNFGDVGAYGEFWSSDEFSSGVGKFHYLMNNNAAFSPYNYSKLYGFSVRCIMND